MADPPAESGIASSADLFERSLKLLPGGVNSPVRSFRAVGGQPLFMRSARGCRMTDVEGRERIDYIGSWGPMILGHAHPQVTAALREALERGTSFGACHPLEIQLAEEIVARVPSIDKVRMVNSGTEAVMSAVRLARAATRREVLVKFAGCYHGHVDALLARAGSGAASLGLPDSPGIPAAVTAQTLVAPYNDLAALRRLFTEHAGRIAAVIVEPVAGNMGVVPPTAGFLQGVRRLTSDEGALLVFDEVMTGFRLARGGAQERCGVLPDLTALGKIIGGGLPVGAYGGPAALMDQVAPAGAVYQAGTLSGNPLAMAAGLATLRSLDAAAYDELERRSARLGSGLQEALDDAGVAGVVQSAGSMVALFFGPREVRDFEGARAADHPRFARFFHGMLQRGVLLPPSGFEAWFVSLAHDEPAIAETLAAAREALAAM